VSTSGKDLKLTSKNWWPYWIAHFWNWWQTNTSNKQGEAG